jgi:peptidyl-prolyl cis-trans isomerase A (cyclophilin A)
MSTLFANYRPILFTPPVRRFLTKVTLIAGIALVLPALLSAEALSGTIVRFATSVGDFDVELHDATAPNTVTNFLNYVNDGDYSDSIVHRSVPNFVIQGGGYYSDLSEIPADSPVVNEAAASNLRGTIAMARTPDPDSATNQWYINTVDNAFLDAQSFTVFGDVIAPGMSIVDQIAALDTIDEGGPFTDLPVFDTGSGTAPSNLVTIQGVTVVPEPTTLTLAALGLMGCAVRWRRRRR